MLKNFFRKKTAKIKAENGQSVVEFAVAFPILIFTVLIAMEAMWYGYQFYALEQAQTASTLTLRVSDIGDTGSLTEDIERVYTGAAVSTPMMVAVKSSDIFGLVPANLVIENAKARFYNVATVYEIPGYSGTARVEESVTRTRYVDISANFRYKITSLTGLGKSFFGENKEIETTVSSKIIVETANRG